MSTLKIFVDNSRKQSRGDAHVTRMKIEHVLLSLFLQAYQSAYNRFWPACRHGSGRFGHRALASSREEVKVLGHPVRRKKRIAGASLGL